MKRVQAVIIIIMISRIIIGKSSNNNMGEKKLSDSKIQKWIERNIRHIV